MSGGYLPISNIQKYDYDSSYTVYHVMAGLPEEGVIIQAESVDFGGQGVTTQEGNALVISVEAVFSILLKPDVFEKLKAEYKDNADVTLFDGNPVGEDIAVNVKLVMGLGTPEDLLEGINKFRRISTFQKNWTKNPPLLFGTSTDINYRINNYRDPEERQKHLVGLTQSFIDQAKRAKVYPFAKIVHPGIGTHDLY
jgi:hypothetical protein